MDFKSPSLNWNAGDMANEFRKFKQVSTLMFKRLMTNISEYGKFTHFLLWVGYNGLDVFNTTSRRRHFLERARKSHIA